MAKSNNNFKIDSTTAIIGSVVILGYFGVLNPLLKFLGIKDSQNTKDLDREAKSSESPWNPLFYKMAPSGSLILQLDSAESAARKIYNSFGPFDDCEECVTAVVKSMKTQSQISFVAETFARLYKQDLLQFLRGGLWPKDRLSDADVNALTKYIYSLPKYKL